jgi:hypothetical protein
LPSAAVLIDGTGGLGCLRRRFDAAGEGFFVAFRPSSRRPKRAPMLASGSVAGRRLFAGGKETARAVVALNRSQLARAQAFAARDLAARWLVVGICAAIAA